jgi:hypothetical protein
MVFCALLAGRKLAVYWGKAGWGAGGVIGILRGVFLFYAVVLVDYLYHRFRPLRPTCRQGKCRSNDYGIKIVVKGASSESENRCKCGDIYVRRENRFMLVQPDGSTKPYLARKPFHNWEPDVAHDETDQRRVD